MTEDETLREILVDAGWPEDEKELAIEVLNHGEEEA